MCKSKKVTWQYHWTLVPLVQTCSNVNIVVGWVPEWCRLLWIPVSLPSRAQGLKCSHFLLHNSWTVGWCHSVEIMQRELLSLRSKRCPPWGVQNDIKSRQIQCLKTLEKHVINEKVYKSISVVSFFPFTAARRVVIWNDIKYCESLKCIYQPLPNQVHCGLSTFL